MFNVTGPKKPATMGSLLVACREAAVSDASFVWVEEPFLLKEGVTPWVDLPLWIPSSDPSFAGFYNVNNSKALKAGLTFRPLSQTVTDTLIWLKTRPESKKLKVGMDIARETELLIKYTQELHE